MRMAMTEPGHRDPAGEIQEFAAVGRVKIGALAPIDGNIPPAVSRLNCWYQGISPARLGWGKSAGTQTYRRRRCPTGAIHRTPPERRLSLPGSHIIGTLLASEGRLADPYHQAGKRRS